jgi:Eco57I methyltransferase-like protein
LAKVSDRPETKRVADVAAVEIGAVTGANDFFLLTRAEAKGMPQRMTRPAVSKAVQVAGARLTGKDHAGLLAEGRKGLMFVADSGVKSRNAAVRSRIALGEELRVPEAYKCRIREDWWSVPLPRRGVADLLLTYFASEHPRLVLNEAGVLQTNTIHGVYLTTQLDTASLAVAFYNSLTLLSAELVGRSYGGGVLKLEPTEAGALILPPVSENLGELLGEVDALIRARKLDAALDLVDPIVLGEGLGLSAAEIRALREGGARLRARRRSRGAPPAAGRD